MNKQELVEEISKEIEIVKFREKDARSKKEKAQHTGRIFGLQYARNLARSLKEPQKPVVPKFVADWFEEHKDKLDDAIWLYMCDWDDQDKDNEFFKWFSESKKPIETLIRMQDGYEIEKVPLYHVKLKIPGATYYLIQTFLMPGDTHMCFSAATERYGAKWKNTFTEAEIKAIDERYWPFAEPVEEVAE